MAKDSLSLIHLLCNRTAEGVQDQLLQVLSSGHDLQDVVRVGTEGQVRT